MDWTWDILWSLPSTLISCSTHCPNLKYLNNLFTVYVCSGSECTHMYILQLNWTKPVSECVRRINFKMTFLSAILYFCRLYDETILKNNIFYFRIIKKSVILMTLCIYVESTIKWVLKTYSLQIHQNDFCIFLYPGCNFIT